MTEWKRWDNDSQASFRSNNFKHSRRQNKYEGLFWKNLMNWAYIKVLYSGLDNSWLLKNKWPNIEEVKISDRTKSLCSKEERCETPWNLQVV
jgi:hypothetical protein